LTQEQGFKLSKKIGLTIDESVLEVLRDSPQDAKVAFASIAAALELKNDDDKEIPVSFSLEGGSVVSFSVQNLES